MIWRVQGQSRDLSRRGMLMGVLNITPDSFSDGGMHLSPDNAIARGLTMLEEGADILDIGGESTRPGAAPVSEAEELRRVLPVIEGLLRQCPTALLSIDTTKAAVALAAFERGVAILNDISGLQADARMVEVAARFEVGIVAMHMQGAPQTMQQAPYYRDVVQEVGDFFRKRLAMLTTAGVAPERLAFDPGIGFGKTVEHNLALLRNLDRLSPAGRPLVVGVSRKSFLAHILGDDAPEHRRWPTTALTAYGREKGVHIFRIHDVACNRDALRMAEAILQTPPLPKPSPRC